MTTRLACLLIAGVALAGFACGAEDPAKEKAAPLQGGWKFEKLEVDGKPAELPDTAFWWFIKGDKVLYGGAELATLTIDSQTSPKCIDVKFRGPKRVLEGIYSIEGDTLKICVNAATEGVRERPTDFSTKGKSGLRLLVFQRDKDRKADSTEGLGGYIGVAIKVDVDSNQVLVVDVVAGGPAEKAGLKKADLILKIAGQEPTDLQSAIRLIRQVKPGGDLTLRIKRDGKEKDYTVKAGVVPFYALE